MAISIEFKDKYVYFGPEAGLHTQGEARAEVYDVTGPRYASMSTVRKHNRSIYEKLEVASRDEMMLYIELLRRCGKLSEIYGMQKETPSKPGL